MSSEIEKYLRELDETITEHKNYVTGLKALLIDCLYDIEYFSINRDLMKRIKVALKIKDGDEY